MKIAIVSPSPLPALKYGGSERVSLWLYKGLLEMSHSALLICPSSKLGKLNFNQIPWPQNTQQWNELFKNHKITLFHFMCPPPENFPINDLPHVITIHGNGKVSEIFPKNSIFVSQNHAKRHNAEAYVYNGIDLSEYPLKPIFTNTQRALFLAKSTWKVKNLRAAIRISKKSTFKLDIAGGSRPLNFWGGLAHHAYFHGMVDDSFKKTLFQKCDALLFPVIWHEPFGIAVIEAMASGLPAIVSPFGSLPEIVTEECGLVSDSETEMIEFLKSKLLTISPHDCRARVKDNFSHLQMTRSYLNYYEKILSGEYINLETPRTLANIEEFILKK